MLQSASGRSSAWLEHLLWEQEVARSNRVAPTIFPFEEGMVLNGGNKGSEGMEERSGSGSDGGETLKRWLRVDEIGFCA